MVQDVIIATSLQNDQMPKYMLTRLPSHSLCDTEGLGKGIWNSLTCTFHTQIVLVIDLDYPAMEKPINNDWFRWDVQTNSQTYPLLVIIQALTRVPLQSLCDKRS